MRNWLHDLHVRSPSNIRRTQRRSAAAIVRLADRFDTRLVVYKDGARVGNSILGLMTLDLRKGAIRRRDHGPGCQCLMDELSSLIDSRFGISILISTALPRSRGRTALR
jgi:phosphotransferase system HPr-like phosphotransfer protein